MPQAAHIDYLEAKLAARDERLAELERERLELAMLALELRDHSIRSERLAARVQRLLVA